MPKEKLIKAEPIDVRIVGAAFGADKELKVDAHVTAIDRTDFPGAALPQNWDYKVIAVPALERMEAALKAAGRQNWELVCVVNGHFIFKKP